jgi:hypothetical protein
MSLLDNGFGMRLMGLVLLVLALALVFAPPLVGQIPLGIAVCLVGIGLVERDGVVVLGGLAVGSVGVSLSLGFVYAIVSGIDTLL